MAISFEQVTYTYPGGFGAGSLPALKGINLQLESGRMIAVLGPPGSGKSTLLQHCNGIVRPTEGVVRVMDFMIEPDVRLKDPNELRRRVGLVFQFPERQLFEATVEEELIYGPRNFGSSLEEAKEKARVVCEQLGLATSLLEQSPFRLSGGQQRKVAIGSVLVSDPDVLALDEPTSSLDPVSREELLQLFRKLVDERGKTVVIVTHRLEEVLPYADEYVVIHEGEVRFHGGAEELLAREDLLLAAGVKLPSSVRFLRLFADKFGVTPPSLAMGADDIAAYVEKVLQLKAQERRDGVCGEALSSVVT